MRGVFQATIQDSLGNVVPECNVEVRSEETGELVQLFDDIDDGNMLGNPIQADADGFTRFYVESGLYRIRVYLGGFERVWRHVVIGIGPIGDEFDAFMQSAQNQFDSLTNSVDDLIENIDDAISNLTASGSFTANLGGFSPALSGTISWARVGNVATMWTSDGVFGTSNSIALSLSGIPEIIRPASWRYASCALRNNGGNGYLGIATISAAGEITFGISLKRQDNDYVQANTAGFTNSGSKGLPPGWTITYPL